MNNEMSNIDLEKAVLSSLMSIQDSYTEISHILKPTDFRADRHSIIYKAIASLSNENMPYDAVMVSDKLGKQLKTIGGETYLNDIISSSPASLFNLEAYAKRVRELSSLYQANQLLIKGQDILKKDGDYTDKINSIIESFTAVLDENTTQKGAETVSEMLPEFINQLTEYIKEQKSPFIRTGFFEIDNKVNIQAGELVIVAGRPASGKTTLAQNILQNIVANQDGVAMFFSLEMAKNQVMQRFIASTANIHLMKMQDGQGMNEDEWARISDIGMKYSQGFNLIVDDRPKLTINQMRSVLNKQRNKYGKIDVIMVDYIQNMGGIGSVAGGERSAVITDIVENLKVFSKEYNCPVFALSQFNRDFVGRPKMENLAESGGIERVADHIWAIYHKPVDDDTPPSNVVEVNVLKQRQGATGKIELKFEGEYNKFMDNVPPIPDYDEYLFK